MYASNLTSQSEAAEVVNDMVGNILSTSAVVSGNDTSSVSGDDIVTELATISSITSNADIVDSGSTTADLVDEYLPNIFDAVDSYIDVTADNTSSNTSLEEVQDALYNIGEQSQALIANLEATLVVDNVSNATDEEIMTVNSLSESLVDYATFAASTALAQSEIGETFNYETYEYDENGTVTSSKVVEAVKFEADNASTSTPSCGDAELPETFMTDADGTFDCAFMSSTTNNFITLNGTDPVQVCGVRM